MSDGALLNDAALGDLALILPGVALADATDALITPDPDVKRRLHTDSERVVPSRHDTDEKFLPWNPLRMGVIVRFPDAGLEGYAEVSGRAGRISPAVIRVASGSNVHVQIFYQVDWENMPRPLPYQPPQVGLQWYYTFDDGSRTDTVVRWDPKPSHGRAGEPQQPNFDTQFAIDLPKSGWLTFSARIDDPMGSVEFDDTIRVLVG